MTTLPSITIEDQAQQKLIQDGLVTADRFVNKSYLININDSKVVPLDERRKSLVPTRLYRIEKLVYDKKENVNDKMISVYSSLMNINGTALLIINGLEREVSFYVGIRSEANPAIAGTILQKSFSGNFPGSILKSLRNSEIAEIMEQGMSTTDQNITKNISCVTVIPSPRDKDKTKFVQGIEKFIDFRVYGKFAQRTPVVFKLVQIHSTLIQIISQILLFYLIQLRELFVCCRKLNIYITKSFSCICKFTILFFYIHNRTSKEKNKYCNTSEQTFFNGIISALF